MKKKKGLTFVIIGTQKYSRYAVDLIESIFRSQQSYFEIFLFSDVCDLSKQSLYSEIHFEVVHHDKWPAMTMQRFKFILSISNQVSTSHVIYVDADALVLEDLGEVLNAEVMTFVQHPGFWRETQPAEPSGTWENRSELTCYVPIELQRSYVCGGVWFGPTQAVVKMSEIIVQMMDRDFQRNLLAIWHDESYVNWFFSNMRSLSIDPSYAYVDTYNHLHNLTPKIKVLDKPENWVRD